MLDNTEKFTGLAEVYRKFRPGYPEALFDCLAREAGVNSGSAVAEIGSGSGIFSGLLLARGVGKLYAVEPNEDMRRCAEEDLAGAAGFVSVPGSAEATTLEDGSVDFVFAVQAFHWFDPEAFRAECRRILRPAGKVVIIWNSRDMSDPMMTECAALCRGLCPNFTGFSGASERSGSGAVEAFFGRAPEFREFPNPLQLSREMFVGRNLSSSYAPRPGEANYRAFVDGLNAIFDRFEQCGQVRWSNATRCYFAPLA